MLSAYRRRSSEEHDDASHSTHSTATIHANTPVRDLHLAVNVGDKDPASTPVLSAPRSSPPVPIKAPGPAPVVGQPLHGVSSRMAAHTSTSQLPSLGIAPLPNQPFSRRRPGSNRSSDRERQKRLRKNVAVVIGDFAGVYPDELTLHLGEQIEIISKDTLVSRNIGWWTGRNDKGKIGIFPSACVKTGTSSIDTTDFVLQQEYPLAIPNHELHMREVIGIGGFGKVYRAVYKGQDVAVKVAKHTSFNSLKAVQEVIAEAERFAHLAHDNVCALIGVVLVKDVCLVMEYASGGALSDILHDTKKAISLPIDIILDWAKQIASGMCYLHHGTTPSLIHRDLKSSNSEQSCVCVCTMVALVVEREVALNVIYLVVPEI